jgi:16S rRNA U516 pseudouridylate synthase RsuA-like enzyme
MVRATKTIKFRVHEGMYNFLKEICKQNGIEMSELLRSIIQYFFIAYTLGELKKPLSQLRKEFNEWLKTKA